jgi:hypothetical protein
VDTPAGSLSEKRRLADFRLEIVGRNSQSRGQKPRHHFRIGNLSRISESGIHREADRQFAALSVVDHASLGADFENSLLLVLRLREVLAVADQLEVTDAPEDRHHPNPCENPND